MTRSFAPILAIALLAACGGKGKDGDSSTTTPDNPCTGMAATASDVVSTAVTLTWSTEEAGTAKVVLTTEDGETTELSSTTSGTDHSLTALALLAGENYTWDASVETGSGTVTCSTQEFKVDPPPNAAMKFDLNISEPGSAVAEGGIVISVITAADVYPAWVNVIDGQGRIRFIKGTDEDWYTVAHARLSRDGQSILFNQFDQERVLDVGSIRRVSWDGTVNTTTRTYLAHHDYVELPDGGFGWMGYDRRDVPMDVTGAPLQADASTHCSGGNCPIAGEVLFEGAEGITGDNDAVEMLNWWDDWDTDVWWGCRHMYTFGLFVPDYYEWFHVNSMAYVDSTDGYYLMSRYTDRMFKVDRASGQIEWQLGGPDSDFTLNSGEWFEHSHMSDVWEDGFLVFDNGDHRGFSRVTEYSFDETNKTVEQVWSMDHPTLQMLDVLGDAKRLPNGNRLVVWSQDALVQEITPAGDVVWELQGAAGGFGVVTRADFVETLPTQVQ